VIIFTNNVNDSAKKARISRHFDILPIQGVEDDRSSKCEEPPVAPDVLTGVSSMIILKTSVPSSWVRPSIIPTIFEDVTLMVAVAPTNVD